MRTWLVVSAGFALVACGAAGDLAGAMLVGAGRVIADAGQAIADAGAQLVDAGSADAQQDAATSAQPAALESECNLVRTLVSGDGTKTVTRWASFDVAMTSTDGIAWLCDGPPLALTCTAGQTCTGDAIPDAECIPTTGYYAKGKLWVQCQGFARATVNAR